jgi:hypothetical protein
MGQYSKPEKHVPPALLELFKLLPQPGHVFTPNDRQIWLRAASATIDAIYPADHHGHLSETPPPPKDWDGKTR